LQEVLANVLKPVFELTHASSDIGDVDLPLRFGDTLVYIQIRSRDDTGGATAKRSLIEPLEKILEKHSEINNLLYLIYIWEPLNENQKGTLINKITFSLKRFGIDTEDSSRLKRGEVISVRDRIRLGVVYGSEQLFEILSKELSVSLDTEKLAKVVEAASWWDDLWVSYAIATLELENLIAKGKTNSKLLNEIVKSGALKITKTDIYSYENASIRFAKDVAVYWKDDLIPFTSLSDKLNYVRDLILLKMAHEFGVFP
jgi:hypothetical protein